MRYAWFIALLGGTLIVLWFLIENWRMLRNKRRRFVHRQALDMGELQSLFPDSRLTLDDFTEFLIYVERATDVPKQYLRPEDRFDTQLAPVRGWEFDDGLILLPEVLQRRFGGDLEAYDLTTSSTLADLLRVVESASDAIGGQRVNESAGGLSSDHKPDANDT